MNSMWQSQDYGWVITKVLLDDEDMQREVGIHGPSDCTYERDSISKHPTAQRFRMLDDDRTPYYEGYICGDDWDGFEPLDDFGMGNAGCTIIQYLADGKWKTI